MAESGSEHELFPTWARYYYSMSPEAVPGEKPVNRSDRESVPPNHTSHSRLSLRLEEDSQSDFSHQLASLAFEDNPDMSTSRSLTQSSQKVKAGEPNKADYETRDHSLQLQTADEDVPDLVIAWKDVDARLVKPWPGLPSFPTNAASRSSWIAARLHPIEFPLLGQFDIAELTTARDHFSQALQSLTFNTVAGKLGFARHDVVTLVNFLFSRVLGLQARHRLSSLIDAYNVRPDEETIAAPMTRPVARAYETAKHKRTPEIFRRFFELYAKVMQPNCHENPLLQQLRKLNYDLQFLEEFDKLHRLASNKDPELMSVFASLTRITGSGNDSHSKLYAYIAATLGSGATVSDLDGKIRPVEALTRRFTRGILVLFPPKTLTRQVFPLPFS
jgi:hypothetical protein